VTRPTFVSVDKKATPPTMTLCFEGQPPRYVTINIRGDTKARDATYLGVTQLRDFTADQIALLDDVARPRDEQPSDVTTILVLDGDDLQPLPNVLVHCPACCANLGNLMTPHVLQRAQVFRVRAWRRGALCARRAHGPADRRLTCIFEAKRPYSEHSITRPTLRSG
jgi:hypothetical protein